MAIRRRGTACRILRTFLFLFRNTKSIANFIPKVWTASQGTIHNPSPGLSSWCFRRPVRRFELVSAMDANSASTVPRVWFLILSFDNFVSTLKVIYLQNCALIPTLACAAKRPIE
jgi:hypothetical protein